MTLPPFPARLVAATLCAHRGADPALAMTVADELRLIIARGRIADATAQTDAQLRSACKTILELLPETPDHHDERKTALDWLDDLQRNLVR